MFRIALSSVRILMGVAAAGMAVWGAYKLGTYLVGAVVGEKDATPKRIEDTAAGGQRDKPLWKRQFSPISAPQTHS